MGLVYKKLEKTGRSMYLYFPEQERRTAFKRCSITILRDGEDEASVRYFLDELGMRKLAEEQEIILSNITARVTLYAALAFGICKALNIPSNTKTGAGIMIFPERRMI